MLTYCFSCGLLLVLRLLYTSALLTISQRSSLELFYDSLGGDSWTWKENDNEWNFITSTNDPCDDMWTGIYCSADNAAVIEIHLLGYNLQGSIPRDFFANMTSIEVLKLGIAYDDYPNCLYNSISGSIPSTISLLTNLTWLDLGGKCICRILSASCPCLCSPVVVIPSANQLSSRIPSAVGALTRLTWLDLHNNSLDSQMPSTMGALASLLLLDLRYYLGTPCSRVHKPNPLQPLCMVITWD